MFLRRLVGFVWQENLFFIFKLFRQWFGCVWLFCWGFVLSCLLFCLGRWRVWDWSRNEARLFFGLGLITTLYIIFTFIYAFLRRFYLLLRFYNKRYSFTSRPTLLCWQSCMVPICYLIHGFMHGSNMLLALSEV